MAVLIPVVTFGFVMVYLLVEAERDALEQRLDDAAAGLSLRIDAELAGQIRVMQSFARSDLLDANAPERFRDHAAALLVPGGGWDAVTLVEPRSGRQIFELARPSAATLAAPPSAAIDRQSLAALTRTHLPVVGDLLRSDRRAGAPVIVVWVPVIRGGEVKFALGAVMRTTKLSELLRQQDYPASWTIALLDREKRIAARSRAEDAFVGRVATPSLAKAIDRAEAGLFVASNQEGDRVYTVFHRSPETGWTVALGVPANEVDVPVRHSLLLTSAGGLIALGLALLLAALVAGDLARRRRFQQRLQETEAALSAFADHTLDWITFVRVLDDGSLVYAGWNLAMAAVSGISSEQVAGKRPGEVFPGELGATLAARYDECVATGHPVEYYQTGEMGGQVRTWHGALVPLRDERGQVTLVVGNARDVTQAQQMADALRRSEQNYRDLYNNTPVALQSENAEGRLISVSDHWLKLFGFDREEVLGRPATDFMTAEAARRYGKLLWPKLRDTPGVESLDLQFARKSGEVLDIRLTVHAARDAQGLFERTLAALVDVTAEKRAEEAMRQAQKMRAIGQLTGGIAHDFNNLLTAVSGNVELARGRVADPPVQRFLDSAAHAAERGASLTRQLLAFARQQHLVPQAVDLNALIVNAEELLQRTIDPTVNIRLALQPDGWAALVDPTQIELVVLNLAINARDAMPEGGTLTILTENIPASEVPAELQLAPGDYVVLTIADTGIGMSDEVRARAFEPFFSTKEVGRGTGLGLSQVHGVVTQSGGAVRIDSAPGRGSLVRVYLPRAPASPEERAPAAAGDRDASGRSACILVVDDDTDVREIAVASLQQAGHRVLSAGHGRAALAVLEDGEPVDLLLADYAMPGMNGIELTRAARRKRPGLRVLLMTGYAEVPGEALAGLTLVKKPFRPSELAARIDEMLSGERTET